ncbi:ABC transporter permease [Nocardiopsis aegyptia]|uniref:ABC transporter permease n=1 Tax=Nocardiopsis aegyptia TaxID=220378 RepID=UPI00366CA88A
MTAARTTAPDRTVPASGGAAAGTGTLLRLALRRDRIRLPAWLLGITVFVPYFHTVLGATSPDQEALEASAALMDHPMVRLFAGPYFGFEEVTLQRSFLVYLPEFLLAAAVMSVLLVARHTRGEEQRGRAELVRASAVGRHAPLTAALALAAGANAVLGALIAAALLGLAFPPSAALLFGAAVATTGLSFAGITAVTAQLTESSRAAAGLASAALVGAWMLRALGAVQDRAGGWATWLSPLGWPQLTRILDDERWWPLVPAVALSAVCAAVAYALAERRDLGAGFLAPRPGRSTAAPWLRGPLSLAWRLQRRSVLWWGAAVLTAALTYGGLGGAMDDGAVRLPGEGPGGSAQDVLDGYLSIMTVSMVFVVCFFAIVSVGTARRDETSGRAVLVLTAATGRAAWLGSSLLVTAAAGVVLVALVGLGTGLGAAVSVGEWSLLPRLLAAALVRAPEVLLTAGLAAALLGWAPRLWGAVWAVVVYGVCLRFFAPNLGLPEPLSATSPYNHVPRVPVEAFALAPSVVLTVLAVVLAALGVWGLGRRDLRG